MGDHAHDPTKAILIQTTTPSLVTHTEGSFEVHSATPIAEVTDNLLYVSCIWGVLESLT